MNAVPHSSRQGQRQLRVGELLRHSLSQVLQRGDINDPVLESHVVTVSEVRLSPDLRQASVFVMPLGGRDEAQVIEALNRHRKYVRGVLARRVELKYMPELTFVRDDSFDAAARMDDLLASPAVRRDTGAADDDAGGGNSGSD